SDAGGIKCRVHRGKDLRVAVVADAGFIDQSVGEHLRETQSRQLDARWDDGLVRGQFRTLTRIERKGLVAVSIQIAAAEVDPIAETMINLNHEIVAVNDVRKAKRIVRPGAGNVLLRVQPKDPGA